MISDFNYIIIYNRLGNNNHKVILLISDACGRVYSSYLLRMFNKSMMADNSTDVPLSNLIVNEDPCYSLM